MNQHESLERVADVLEQTHDICAELAEMADNNRDAAWHRYQCLQLRMLIKGCTEKAAALKTEETARTEDLAS